MGRTPYKLSDEVLIERAESIIHEISATKYQKDVLTTIVRRFYWNRTVAKDTTEWAQKAFDENRRLIEIVNERWKEANKEG
jgi:hypothetical protein